MILNAPGKMVEHWWKEIPNKFPNVKLGKYEIMPNHLHGTIFVNEQSDGSIRRSTPTNTNDVGADLWVSPFDKNICPNPTLGKIIQWFKIMTTNDYIVGVKTKNWPVFPKRLWQRNYFERIVRNEEELFKIENYIRRNPGNWNNDPENRRLKVV